MIVTAGGCDTEVAIAGGISTINRVVTRAKVDVMGSRGQRDVIITITSGNMRTTFDGVVSITSIDGVTPSTTD